MKQQTANSEETDRQGVTDRIAAIYPELTESMRKFADFVLDDPLEVARLSIHSAVSVVGVSVATAHRFVTKIGYSGYAEFRKELFRSFRDGIAVDEKIRESSTRFDSANDVFRAELKEVPQNIETMLRQNKPEDIERAVDRIVEARRIYVIGTHASVHLAALLAIGIEHYRSDVFSNAGMHGALGTAQQLFRCEDSDLVIAIAFPRYFRDTVELARFVSERGVPVLGITDSLRSPLVATADQTLLVNSKRLSTGLVSDGSVLAFIEALTSAVAYRLPDASENELAFSEFALPWFTRT